MSGAGGGFAGTVNGSFFEAPPWVDKSKPPGGSKQVAPTWEKWLMNVLKARHFFFSPNFVWFSVALFVYLAFPYDLQAARSFGVGWVLKRLAVNLAVTWLYVGFWDVALYGLQWSKRKFNPLRWPNRWELFHNVWYANLGILQWTVWEVFFIYAYATGRLPYIRDREAFATVSNAVIMVLFTLAVPVWRGLHFYFAHRFIHIRPMYRFVHSLHHRNTDIEPAAGLCMHPVEHMYYFSCIAPSLYLYLSPFHFAFNGWHLLLSPAASHSGWEDHMQSDQFHYLHHARFECNYGSASFPLDNMFGTFVDVLDNTDDAGSCAKKGVDTTVANNSKSEVDASVNQDGGLAAGRFTLAEVAKHTRPTDCWVVVNGRVLNVTDFLPRHPGGERALFAFAGKDATRVFNTIHPAGVIEKYAPDAVIGELATAGAAPADVGSLKASLLAKAPPEKVAGITDFLPTRDYAVYFSFTLTIFLVLWLAVTKRLSLHLYPYTVAGLLGFGPVLFALALCLLFGEQLDFRWPFQHESMFGRLGLHLAIGFLIGVLPVYHTLTTVLAEGPFCHLWDPLHEGLCAAAVVVGEGS